MVHAASSAPSATGFGFAPTVLYAKSISDSIRSTAAAVVDHPFGQRSCSLKEKRVIQASERLERRVRSHAAYRAKLAARSVVGYQTWIRRATTNESVNGSAIPVVPS